MDKGFSTESEEVAGSSFDWIESFFPALFSSVGIRLFARKGDKYLYAAQKLYILAATMVLLLPLI